MKYPFLDLKTVNNQYLGALKEALARVLESGRYIGGPEVEGLEKAIAELCGTDYAVGVANGLDAIRLILLAFRELGRLKEGDEVIVPANTYIASLLAVTQAGLVPVLVEPDEHSFNLDTSLIEKHLTARTKAILTVHLYGRPCYDSTLAEAARRHDLLVIEDNAQAIGATAKTASPKGTFTTGGLGNAGALSFYPTKNLGALGDGGMVTTNDPALAATVRALANYGSDRRYHNIYVGWNSRLDPVQAAFLSAKLPHLHAENERRRALAARYSQLIANPLVRTPEIESPDGSVWHQYVVHTPYRDQFIDYLAANGVGTDIHYAVPPHLQPCYADLPHDPLPLTERLAQEIVSLPISSCTTLSDAEEIATIINAFHDRR